MNKISCKNCALAKICLPFSLESEQLDSLDNKVNKKSVFKRGETIYQEGKPFHSIYAIRSGAIKSIVSQGNHEQISAFFLPGEIFGFDGIHANCYTATTIAITETAVCKISFEDLVTLSQDFSGMHTHLLSLMSQEIASNMHAHLHCSAETKLAHFIFQLSQRFQRRSLSRKQFTLPMSRQDIANYLGMATETISRILTHFQQDGLIEIDNRHLTILSTEKLEYLICKP